MSDIVVGIDGAEGSEAVLEWAVREASLRGVTLRIVSAIQSPATWLGMGEALGSAVTASVSDADLNAYALSMLDEVIGRVGDTSGVEIVKETKIGHPADVLIQMSEDAELLVLGSSGHGDIGSVLLGSVGMHCVHHSHCPVVIVPTKTRR